MDALESDVDRCTMQVAFELTRSYYESLGQLDRWELVCEAFIIPTAQARRGPCHADLAKKYRLKGAHEVSVAVDRAKERLDESLKRAIAGTVPWEDVEAEYRRIRAQYG